MKNPFRISLLPFLTLGLGGIGLCLRLWLFSATDELGLLPAAHFADTALYLLTALTLGLLFLAGRRGGRPPFPRKAMHLWDVLGHILGGAALLLSAVAALRFQTAALTLLSFLSCLAGGFLMLFTGIVSFGRRSASYLIYALLTVVLVLYTVSQCRTWGAEPQLQMYFFPLMSSVFAILTAYYRTELAAGRRKPRLLAFFSQGCLFFCCLSLNTHQWPMYLGLLLWSSAQLIPCFSRKKEV